MRPLAGQGEGAVLPGELRCGRRWERQPAVSPRPIPRVRPRVPGTHQSPSRPRPLPASLRSTHARSSSRLRGSSRIGSLPRGQRWRRGRGKQAAGPPPPGPSPPPLRSCPAGPSPALQAAPAPEAAAAARDLCGRSGGTGTAAFSSFLLLASPRHTPPPPSPFSVTPVFFFPFVSRINFIGLLFRSHLVNKQRTHPHPLDSPLLWQRRVGVEEGQSL